MSTQNERSGMFIGGIIVTGVGVFFLLDELGFFDVGRLWPVFPILVGVALIVGSFRKRDPERSE